MTCHGDTFRSTALIGTLPNRQSGPLTPRATICTKCRLSLRWQWIRSEQSKRLPTQARSTLHRCARETQQLHR